MACMELIGLIVRMHLIVFQNGSSIFLIKINFLNQHTFFVIFTFTINSISNKQSSLYQMFSVEKLNFVFKF